MPGYARCHKEDPHVPSSPRTALDVGGNAGAAAGVERCMHGFLRSEHRGRSHRLRLRPQSRPAEYHRISASGSTLDPAAACFRDDATSISRNESPPCTAAPCVAPALGSWAKRSCSVIPGGCFEPPSLRPTCDVARWLRVVVSNGVGLIMMLVTARFCAAASSIVNLGPPCKIRAHLPGTPQPNLTWSLPIKPTNSPVGFLVTHDAACSAMASSHKRRPDRKFLKGMFSSSCWPVMVVLRIPSSSC
mmetsp:Transcript_7889/g.18813  ORF Transcript_7889/g.18813 Transcript_7889/m.18813 type:complete len:246 (+) Transcript_7889:234-971(+)